MSLAKVYMLHANRKANAVLKIYDKYEINEHSPSDTEIISDAHHCNSCNVFFQFSQV